MIDSHCHLDFDIYSSYRAALLTRMTAAGFTGYIIPGVKAKSWSKLMLMAEQDNRCGIALGLHPAFMSAHQAADLDCLERCLSHKSVVALGEIGLNRLTSQDDLSEQKELLKQQLTLAKEQGLPVILHARQSLDELIAMVRALRFGYGGIVHAFTGSEQQARSWLQLGFKLGVGGAVTHPRAKKLRRTIASLPKDSMVLETDSPDMRPSFLPRESENTPLVIPLIAAVVGALRKEEWRQVVENSDKAIVAALPRYASQIKW